MSKIELTAKIEPFDSFWEAPEDIENPVNTTLGEKVTLLGYNFTVESPKPGAIIEVTWFWQVEDDVGPGWRLFTHAVGNKDKLKNYDHVVKVRKKFQPGKWKKGMVIRDSQKLKIPPVNR